MPQQFKSGDQVEIPVEVGQGAFPTEALITFETIDGPISGFVRKDDIVKCDHDTHRGYVSGVVKDVTPDVISVVVRGSFFRTTGLATLARQWAVNNLHLAGAA